ncbi:response regulator [Horticoccus luteus]|uniref:Response regulator n=1 Tax=Horticoccus luteus TaxID=2862869 RepID=A0A8F9TW97_9BACT|nr:response regulator [Horticoccus luteus]QYM80414.1 response regulator [Horticoccus luteus]
MSPPAKVLVVDDTPANISLMLDALSDAGYDVLVAESAASALALLAHNTPDLFLLDVLMPQVNGFELCAILKRDERCREVPVLFMTALHDAAEKVRAFSAGAVDYITKPVYPPEVLARVAAHLQIRALQRSLADELALRIEAENELSQSLDRAVLLVDAAGRIVFSTRRAENLLHQHFPARDAGALPANLADAESPLDVRRFAETGRTDLVLLMLDEKRSTLGPPALIALGLTPREAEILYWIAQGKSNPDVATILGANVRTVHKHVENIFRKLGCETRTAATVAALEILRPDAR